MRAGLHQLAVEEHVAGVDPYPQRTPRHALPTSPNPPCAPPTPPDASTPPPLPRMQVLGHPARSGGQGVGALCAQPGRGAPGGVPHRTHAARVCQAALRQRAERQGGCGSKDGAGKLRGMQAALWGAGEAGGRLCPSLPYATHRAVGVHAARRCSFAAAPSTVSPPRPLLPPATGALNWRLVGGRSRQPAHAAGGARGAAGVGRHAAAGAGR